MSVDYYFRRIDSGDKLMSLLKSFALQLIIKYEKKFY